MQAPDWTDSDDQKIIRMREEGLTLREMAEALGRTRAAMGKHCALMVQQGKIPSAERGEARSIRVARGNAIREGAWTDTDDDLVITMRNKGATCEEIATALDRPLSTLKKHIAKLQAASRLPLDEREVQDLAGLPFGDLLVLERAPDELGARGQRYPAWRCQCSGIKKDGSTCDAIIVVRHYNLLYENKTHCGCQKKIGRTKEEQRIAKLENTDKLKRERSEAGMCIGCGKERPSSWNGFGRPPTNEEHNLYCDKCKETSRAYQRTYRNKAIQEGLCTDCRTPSVIGIYCERHWYTHKARDATGKHADGPALAHILQEQSGQCVYTGLAITPGKDASVDHKIPLSRDGARALTNLQWVHILINRMKNDLDHDLFLELCLMIVEYTGAQRNDKHRARLVALLDETAVQWNGRMRLTPRRYED